MLLYMCVDNSMLIAYIELSCMMICMHVNTHDHMQYALVCFYTTINSRPLLAQYKSNKNLVVRYSFSRYGTVAKAVIPGFRVIAGAIKCHSYKAG